MMGGKDRKHLVLILDAGSLLCLFVLTSKGSQSGKWSWLLCSRLTCVCRLIAFGYLLNDLLGDQPAVVYVS